MLSPDSHAPSAGALRLSRPRHAQGRLSLDVAEGSLVAIVGPNGHGKTTLLRTISGLVRPSAGTIMLDGRRIDRLRADEIVAAGVVQVPQGDLLFPEMTVLENLLMGAYLACPPPRM